MFFLALIYLQVRVCAYGHYIFSHVIILPSMPRAQLFELDGLNPPRRISKLSLRYRRSIAARKKANMPPRVAWPPSGRATVNQNHPAATAAAARVAAAGKINGGKIAAPTSRDSPSRAAKTLANEKNSEICNHNPRAAVAVEAPTMPKLRPVSRLISLP